MCNKYVLKKFKGYKSKKKTILGPDPADPTVPFSAGSATVYGQPLNMNSIVLWSLIE